MPERKEWKQSNKIFEAIMTENVPQVNTRPQTADPGSSETTKQGKTHTCTRKTRNKTKPTRIHIMSNFRKSKIKKKFGRSERGKKKNLPIEEHR